MRSPLKNFSFSIPLRTNIMTIFVLIFLMFSAFIVWFNYSQNTKAALQAADRLMADISEKVRERTEGQLQPLFDMAHLSTELPGMRRKPIDDAEPTDLYLMRALERNPQILSFYRGYEDGDFYQIQGLAGADNRLHQRLQAPDSTRFARRHIRHSAGGHRIEDWDFLANNHSKIGTRSNASPNYDPRVRPWYKRARAHERQVIVTDLYVFSSTSEIGITVAKGFDDPASGVFGADVTLANLSDFVAKQRLSDASLLFIFDRRGRLVAHHDKSALSQSVTEDGKAKILPSFASDLKNPVVDALMVAFDDTGGTQDVQGIFEVDGERHIARITRLPLSGGGDWFLAFIVPVHEFIGPIIKTGTWSFLISLGAVCLIIPLLVLAARMISRPLNQLVEEADDIREFRLEKPVDVQSNVKEVQRLTEAVTTTKAALQTFAQYVPHDLVKQLVQSGDVAQVGGQRREITILFSDVADFTTISESMSPEAMMKQMSHYLKTLGSVIIERHGTIDKYIGDAIMAFWNAPLRDEDHARNACLAALECKAKNEALNAVWSARDEPIFKTRFGVHLGEAVVGNVGSSDRMNYTAIGEAVNLAARLEGLNKHYGTQILVSEPVAQALDGDFLFRVVDRVMPKGATRSVEIFELIGMLELSDENQQMLKAAQADIEYCAQWRDAIDAFRSGAWSTAADKFAALAKHGGFDPLRDLYAERSASFVKAPPPSNWDGVEIFDTK